MAVVLVGAGSYAFRVVPLLAAGRVRPMPAVERLLGHVPPAVLSALAVTAVLRHDASGRPHDTVAVVVALAVGMALAHRRLPVVVTVAGGIAGYWSAALGVGLVLG